MTAREKSKEEWNDRSRHDKKSLSINSRMECIQAELMMEILSRVPTLDLLKLRCVCKRWNNILDDPLFRQNHYSRSLSKPDENRVLILRQRSGLYLVDSTDKVRIDMPRFSTLKGFYFYGSCNGLLCFGNQRSCWIFVVNPFTRQHVLFPMPPDLGRLSILSWGFGFNESSKLYKVILVDRSEVRVCEFGSGGSTSWRSIGVSATSYRTYCPGSCTVNGRLHWPCTAGGLYHIMSFDLDGEEFRLMPVPSCLHDGINDGFDLIVFGGCLAIFDSRVPNTPRLQIWVMKKYGIKTSWGMEFYAQPPIPTSLNSCLNINQDKGFSKVLGSLKDGELVVWKYGMEPGVEAVSISSNSKSDELKIKGPLCALEVIIHTASLNWIGYEQNFASYCEDQCYKMCKDSACF